MRHPETSHPEKKQDGEAETDSEIGNRGYHSDSDVACPISSSLEWVLESPPQILHEDESKDSEEKHTCEKRDKELDWVHFTSFLVHESRLR